MMALDTNVLVRFLVKDDEAQARIVYQLFKQSENNGEVLFVPLLVVLETIWVLQSIYCIENDALLSALGELSLMPVLLFEAPSIIQGLIASGREENLDLSDILIAHSARSSNCSRVYTFDKKAAKFRFFEHLKL